MVIVAGLVIGLAEDTGGRLLSKGPPPRDEIEDLKTFNREVRALNAAQTGKKLIEYLYAAPGDDFKTSHHRIHSLAHSYAEKWDNEDRVEQAKLSEIAKTKLQQDRDAAWRRVKSAIDGLMAVKPIPNREIIEKLASGVGMMEGQGLQFLVQRFNDHLREQARKAAERPKLAREMEQLLLKGKAANESERKQIMREFSILLDAHEEARIIWRWLPSTNPPIEPFVLAWREADRRLLADANPTSYEAGVKLISDNLHYGTDDSVRSAAARLLGVSPY